MKVSLVVASGVHQGRVIPIAGNQFLIGRDPQCQLRPASPAISKQHCGLYVRGGKVFVKDFGSTNGTFVNDQQVPADAEVEVTSGDRLKAGPLDFTVNVVSVKPSDATPLPAALKKPADDTAEAKAATPPAVAPVEAPAKPQAIPGPQPSGDEDAAALLLGMGDEDSGTPPKVPEGSTVMELPAQNAGAADPKKDGKKAIASKEDTSNAASEILRRYMRRTK
jgi:pSer/pThr/pTyr-binding forkhead associated (FHA) protein